MPDTPTLPQAEPNAKVAPGLETELDAALSSLNPNITKEPIEKEISKAVDNKIEPSKEETVEKSKPMGEIEESLPEPDKISDKPDPKQEGWNSLRNNYKKAKGKIQEWEEKFKKLEMSLAEKGTTSTKEVEALKAKVQELSKYQAKTDLQTDPEFVSKFDAPIQEKVDSLKGILKEWNISDDIINKIDFSNKNTLGAIAKAIRANQDNIHSEFSIEEFMTNARDVIDLHKKKNSALDEHGKNYQQVLEEKKKQSFAKNAEDEGRTLKHLQEIAASKDKDGNFMIPFLNKMTAKENSTPAEASQIEAHNEYVDSIYQKIDSEIKTNDPERKAKLVVAAAAANFLGEKLKIISAENKALKEELQKISISGSETEKTKVKSPARNGKEMDLDLDNAINNFRSEVANR